MIGLEVLTWGTQGHESAYYYPIYHYLWGGGDMGHTALKLTLPRNPEVDAWMQQYCREGDKILIPHYQVTRQIAGQACSQWIVYFSWWPGELQEEYGDRMSANTGVQIEYAEKWRPMFTQTITEKPGYLRHRFGFLYDMIFGKPKEIPKPISHIVHPCKEQAQIQQDLDKLTHEESIYAEQESELLEKLMTLSKLENHMNYLFMRTKRKLEYCVSEAQEYEVSAKMTKACESILAQLDKISQEIDPILEQHQSQKQKLIEMRRYLCEQAVTVGCQPETVYLSFGEQLSPENMLKAMNCIMKGPYTFHKFLYNCTSVAREVIESGLAPQLQGHEGRPHLFDTPLKIRRFAMALQTELISNKLQNLTMASSSAFLLQYPATKVPPVLQQEHRQAPKPSFRPI